MNWRGTDMCPHSATNHNHLNGRDGYGTRTPMEIVEGLERDNFLRILRDPEPLDERDVAMLMNLRDDNAEWLRGL